MQTALVVRETVVVGEMRSAPWASDASEHMLEHIADGLRRSWPQTSVLPTGASRSGSPLLRRAWLARGICEAPPFPAVDWRSFEVFVQFAPERWTCGSACSCEEAAGRADEMRGASEAWVERDRVCTSGTMTLSTTATSSITCTVALWSKALGRRSSTTSCRWSSAGAGRLLPADRLHWCLMRRRDYVSSI